MATNARAGATPTEDLLQAALQCEVLGGCSQARQVPGRHRRGRLGGIWRGDKLMREGRGSFEGCAQRVRLQMRHVRPNRCLGYARFEHGGEEWCGGVRACAAREQVEHWSGRAGA
ncbi:hypothetical protein PYCCODRAFT_542134 [Trametes coccinea BRFM310]|uniref:Uncharacterized protein n=1 Tax=Trametes coccinea (strain BRFM310) TaxID=1353009 RepID=A0A1Y2IJP9_TRAC3|nr:hypothetical protein PYCCODRAFT_542134 [Trametes coccinea BRFM310]